MSNRTLIEINHDMLSGLGEDLGWWGKKRRDWGFRTPTGWVPWKEYVSRPGWKS